MSTLPPSFAFISEVSDRSESTLFTELAGRGHRCVLICHPREPKIQQFRDSGISVYPLAIKSRLDLGTAHKVRSIFQKEQVTGCYATMNKGIACASLASLGLKVRLYTYRGTMGNLSRWNPTTYLTHLNPQLSGIVCNCEAVKRSLQEFGLPEEKLSVVLKGHDPNWYQPSIDKNSPEILRGEFKIICVANIRPVKGIDLLIRAAALINNPAVQVYLVGENRDRSLSALPASLGIESQVHFLGFRKDLHTLFPQCEVSIMPSRDREGVPRSIVESIFYGTPVIASRVGGIPELIEGNTSGLLFLPEDVKALSDAIQSYIDNPEMRAAHLKRARADLMSKLDLKTYVDSFERILF